MKQFKTYLLHAGAVLLAVIFSWGIHEFAHWSMSKALGYSPIMTLNTVSLSGGDYEKGWHAMLVSAVGPGITILQAFVVYWLLIKKGWYTWLFPHLLLAFYTRALAGFMNLFNLNDEGRIGHDLGLGDFTLSILVSGLLFYWVWRTVKTHQPGWRYITYTLFLIMLFSSILILADNAWHPVLLG